ncbi:molybdenum cofactor guanylyltransferase [Paenibacillus sp. HB172176]|uniref:molybdenum cofactor guanylyltransferase n=1 Tax=Paenibacillus sp. HB172176 TaxID=2493690 RepID=UPI001439436F|nr:molybdenum cofactor guanylyltransferase [Paenibacillus sp. HB172176]
MSREDRNQELEVPGRPTGREEEHPYLIADGEPLRGLIIAGGLSRRMGEDKAQLMIGGEALLTGLVRQMLPLTQSLVVAAGTSERADVYRKLLGEYAERVSFVTDQYAGKGPLAGLHAGLTALQGDGYVFVMACDMPKVSRSLLARLIDACGDGEDAIHVEGQPFHGLYRTSAARHAREALQADQLRFMSFLERIRTMELHALSAEEESELVNLNTQDDYNRYRERRIE